MIALFLATLAATANTPAPVGPAGLYGMEMRVRSLTRVPVIKDVTTTSVSRALVAVTEGPGGLAHEQEVCSVRVEGQTGLARTIIPERFVDALPASRFPIAWDGVSYRVDMDVSHVGYDPALSSGALPSDDADPAVFDWDGDGRPGATVEVKVRGFGSFSVEVIQRAQALLEGTLQADGTIEGRVASRLLEQRVIGADHPLLRSSPRISPLDEESTFRMVPVPPGSSCEDVEQILAPKDAPGEDGRGRNRRKPL